MATPFNESVVEEAALDWLVELGYQRLYGAAIAPGAETAERASYEEMLLLGRLRAAVARINPLASPAALDEAVRRLLRRESQDLLAENRRLHHLLRDGVTVGLQRPDGSTAYERVLLIDFERPEQNDLLAVNQLTVKQAGHSRRPDLVVFVNGLPLVVLEFKDATDADATIDGAFNQLQTYANEIPDLFVFNALLAVADGLRARLGCLTAPFERFMPWRTVDGSDLAPAGMPELQMLVRGALEPSRLLPLVRSFLVFEADGPNVTKKLAAYHQFHAVNRAVERTLEAVAVDGDRRAGVVWHTQGSGKSLTMVFFAGLLVLQPALQNPTIVVITDRNDLDGQLFATFAHCSDLLRQTPEQADSRAGLKALLQVAAGGIVFTTIQKFMPEERGGAFPLLSDRRNIVVMADEAHRSQYDFIDGYARHLRDALPNATFIGFTGTPVELGDRVTTAVFGDYIDIYDIQQAVEDRATVPIFYESRLAKLSLADEQRLQLDAGFEELTEDEEQSTRNQLKAKWAALEAIVGASDRIALVAADLVTHFEQRLAALDGKAMVVCMSRRICVDMYDAIAALRPGWVSNDDASGALKVVMTGAASDEPAWQQHIRNKLGRERIATRFKDAADPLRLVIVRDMWLTGFDVPSLHTMYVNKSMRGHGLMQAIARVNRVFRDKPGGLVVDYIGIADQLQAALATYVQSGGHGTAAVDQAAAVRVLLEKHDVVAAMFHGFDLAALMGGGAAGRLQALAAALERILAQQDGKKRFLDAFGELRKAFALAVPDERALALRDDIVCFQVVRDALADRSTPAGQRPGALDQALRQLVSRAITPHGVVDIFSAAGLQKPDISVLSEQFLAEVRRMPQRNLAVELLQKLLNNELRTRAARSVVQSRLFSEKLVAALRAYENRSIETARVIEELIQIARDLRAAQARGEQLHLNPGESAFYDALAAHGDVVEVMGDQVLADIARRLAADLRRSATVDWKLRESGQARMRLLVRRILRQYGYPPDQQESAIVTVLQQAELFADELVA